MEFILNNKKYRIVDEELYINFLMVDNYFRYDYSRYDYDISFDFIDPLLDKEKIEFEDIKEGSQELKELIEKGEVNFIPAGVKIDEHVNGNFRISYQDLEFVNVSIGEAVPFLIALNSLLTHKPIVTLTQIEDELNYFLEKFRDYPKD